MHVEDDSFLNDEPQEVTAQEFGVSPEELAAFKKVLMTLSDEEKARMLLSASLDQLLINIKEGMSSASDLNVARQFLKDNDIGIVPTRENVAGKLAEALRRNSANSDAANAVPVEKLGEFDVTDFMEGIH